MLTPNTKMDSNLTFFFRLPPRVDYQLLINSSNVKGLDLGGLSGETLANVLAMLVGSMFLQTIPRTNKYVSI